MNDASAIAELARSPHLRRHVRHFQELLTAENQRREQFYEEIDENMKVEFIDGEVIVHSPARAAHLDASTLTGSLLARYVMDRDLGKIYFEKCLIECDRNAYEPDICFFGRAKAREIQPDRRIFTPPDLIVEILSPSTAKNDRNVKLRDYAASGVTEYWIIDADECFVDQFTLPEGADAYVLRGRLGVGGQLESAVLEGLELPVVALFDVQENNRALRRLLQN